MKQDDKKKDGGQKDWLKEHDSIQVDLLKMKDELVTEVDDGKEAKERTVKSQRPEKREERSPPPGSPPETNKIQYQSEMSIKQMLGEKRESEKVEKPNGQSTGEPPRLEEGTIPKSPELTSKIANVLQLENKLKRRKFELEKRSSNREVPPPPKKPGNEQTVPENGRTEIKDSSRYPEITLYNEKDRKKRTVNPEEEDIEPPKKQIHISSDKPYPKGLDQEIKPNEDEEEMIEELEEFEEVEEPKEKKKKRRGIFSIFSRNR
jgi:hypothetical protein